MAVILNIALPFFALIFLGYGALRGKVVDQTTVRGLNVFVYWFALPALVIPKVAAAPIDRLFDPSFFLTYYGASMALFAAMLAYGRLAHSEDGGTSALRALGAVFTNSGYMGIPLLLAAFGPAAAIPSVLALAIDNIISIPLTIALVEASRGGENVAEVLRNTFRGISRNPFVLSVVAGMLLALSGLELPGMLASFTTMLGAAASPCALFALGAALASVPVQGAVSEILLVTVVKIFGHPLLVWLIAVLLIPLEPQVLEWTIITAALPTAATVFVLSQRYELFPSVSTVVLVTHLVSVVTLSALLVWFH